MIKRILSYRKLFTTKIKLFFYKLSGVKLIQKVWIGNKCYLDTNFSENILIGKNVCKAQVSIVCHFDQPRVSKITLLKNTKKVIIEDNVFIGPKSIIMPGVIIRNNTFVRAGSVITKSTKPNTIVHENPQRRTFS